MNVAARLLIAVCVVSGFAVTTGCLSPGERATLVQTKERLRTQNQRLERIVAQRDGTIARLHRQVEELKGFDPKRPIDLFAPVRIEIASLTGGADYDGKPGDDGVTVHLRPRDRDNDAVKTVGRITIQLVDNSVIGSPHVLGVYVFDDPAELRRAWHGKFGTNHYTLRCPFPPGVDLPPNRNLTVRAEFIDFLTGVILTAARDVSIEFASTALSD